MPSTHGSSQKVTPENPKVIGDDDLADVMNLSPEPTNELLRGRSAGCKQPSCLNGMHEFGDTEARGGVTARALSYARLGTRPSALHCRHRHRCNSVEAWKGLLILSDPMRPRAFHAAPGRHWSRDARCSSAVGLINAFQGCAGKAQCRPSTPRDHCPQGRQRCSTHCRGH